MFCPKCRSELEPGYMACERCGVALVDDLPQKPTPEYVDLRTVFVAPDEYLLTVAILRLESEGIRCATRNNPPNISNAYSFMVLGPLELQVPAEDAERAAAILEAIDAGT